MEKLEEKVMNERRIENCVRAAKLAPKGSWAYKFWMSTSGKLLKKLYRNNK
jgi:hypothetical protein